MPVFWKVTIYFGAFLIGFLACAVLLAWLEVKVGKEDYRVQYDPIFPSRSEAEKALEHMRYLLDKYQYVSVVDLMELLGKGATWEDADHGWVSLALAQVRRVRKGYKIVLPNPVKLP